MKGSGLRNLTLVVAHRQRQLSPQRCRHRQLSAVVAKLRVAGGKDFFSITLVRLLLGGQVTANIINPLSSRNNCLD